LDEEEEEGEGEEEEGEGEEEEEGEDMMYGEDGGNYPQEYFNGEIEEQEFN
jgi:hypothetical protein